MKARAQSDSRELKEVKQVRNAPTSRGTPLALLDDAPEESQGRAQGWRLRALPLFVYLRVKRNTPTAADINKQQ